MNKKTFFAATAAAACMVIGSTGISASANEPIKIYVNGERVEFTDVQPYITSNRTLAPLTKDTTMVPMKDIFESLGWTVQWNNQNNIASVSLINDYGDDDIDTHKEIRMGDGIIIYSICGKDDGQESGSCTILPDVEPVIVNDHIMIPLRLVMQIIGEGVSWDSATNSIYIGGSSDEVLIDQKFADFIGELPAGQADNFAADIDDDGKLECVVFSGFEEALMVYNDTDSSGNPIVTETYPRSQYPTILKESSSIHSASDIKRLINSLKGTE